MYGDGDNDENDNNERYNASECMYVREKSSLINKLIGKCN